MQPIGLPLGAFALQQKALAGTANQAHRDEGAALLAPAEGFQDGFQTLLPQKLRLHFLGGGGGGGHKHGGAGQAAGFGA